MLEVIITVCIMNFLLILVMIHAFISSESRYREAARKKFMVNDLDSLAMPGFEEMAGAKLTRPLRRITLRKNKKKLLAKKVK